MAKLLIVAMGARFQRLAHRKWDMNETELAQVIDRAKRKDPDAFECIIDAYGKRLLGYLYRLTGSRDDAEDLLQELFLRVVRMIDGYEHDGRFLGWLFRIATNLVRDRVRRLARLPRTVTLPHSAEADGAGATWMAAGDLRGSPPDAPMVFHEEVDALQRALARLPAAEREVIMLRHFAELSFAEIAECMGTPLGTALARGHRGLGKLRELMTTAALEQSP
jgi:RNA polymerase sigma-70 factor (ECF subfamily)